MLLATIFLTATPPLHPQIPVVDLAFEAERQIIVDQEIGQYLGHPTTCLLEDGQTVVCVPQRARQRRHRVQAIHRWRDDLERPAADT